MFVYEALLGILFDDYSKVVKTNDSAFQWNAIGQVDGDLHLFLARGIQHKILYIVFVGHGGSPKYRLRS